MGSRKHIMAERLKAEKKQKAIAVLKESMMFEDNGGMWWA